VDDDENDGEDTYKYEQSAVQLAGLGGGDELLSA